MAAAIEKRGGPRCRIVVIRTTGDHLQQAPLSEAGGKRLFVKEIEDALVRGDIDLAVHSSKDMPVALPDGLAIAAALAREDPLDAVVLPPRRQSCSDVTDLVALVGESAAIGTSSVRRVAQLIRLLPNARFLSIRGNLDSRLRKLDAGEYDALVLAAAGLRRLGFASRISLRLPPSACVPAPGQGIVAVETRADDPATRRFVEPINDPDSRLALEAERAVVEALGGGCQTPIGALATPQPVDTIEVIATVVAPDGSRALRAQARGPQHDAVALGRQAAAQLLDEGAGEILAAAGHTRGAVEGIQP